MKVKGRAKITQQSMRSGLYYSFILLLSVGALGADMAMWAFPAEVEAA